MAPRHYAGARRDHEAKLGRVMQRMKATDWNWNWDRTSAWVRFTYKGQPYYLDQTCERARAAKEDLADGIDCLAQIVLTLEDLARMAGRGIYDLQTFMAGFKALPAPAELPAPLVRLGFTEMPASGDVVRQRYRQLAKTLHPDNGGDAETFRALTDAATEAVALVEGGS